jgi:hypothetical protein
MWVVKLAKGTADPAIHGSLRSDRRSAPVALVVRIPNEPVEELWNPTVLVAALGLAGTLGAVALVELYTRRRDRRTQRLAWNTKLFDAYEKAFREFLATWSGSTTTATLEAAFAKLQRDAVIPRRIVDTYETVLVTLRSSAEEQSKKDAAASLRREIDRSLRDPVGLAA